MTETLVSVGLACLIAAIVGGGLSAFGIVVPVFGSVQRQTLLAVLGAALVVGGLRPDLWQPGPSPEPDPSKEQAPSTSPPAHDTPFSNKVLKATKFYFGGRGYGLRVSDAEISCIFGKCELGFTAATCAREYIPTQGTGPIVTIVLVDREGKDLTQIIRTTAAWVRNKDDYNRITHPLPDGWIRASAWNNATRLIIKPGWQERSRGACV